MRSTRPIAKPANETITFNIPGAGAQVITPLTDLPQITDPVKSTATRSRASAPAASAPGSPLIVIDGTNVFNSLAIEGSGIKGEGANNTVGGPDPADRSVVSDNTYAQVTSVAFPGTSNATGTAAVSSGTAAVANNVAIAVEGGDNNQIGGTGSDEANLISRHRVRALTIDPGDSSEAGFDGGPAVGTVIEGNKIGTDVGGSTAIANNTRSVGMAAAVEVSSGPTTIGGAAPEQEP